MKVLVTGGAGFLGLHVARCFAKKKADVIVLDRAPIEAREYPKGTKYIKGDVRNAGDVKKAMKGIDVVVHAAAALPLSSAEEIMDVNVNGTRTVLETAHTMRIPRVIHISSTAVYGVPKTHPVRESDPMVGVGPYGKSKIEAESICEEYRKKGLFVTVIRPKTFVGTHRLGVFEILFDWIKDGKRIPVVGSGNNTYQLLDVDDLAEAIYLCATQKNKALSGTFNIGAEKYGTVRDDLGALFAFARSGSRTLATPAFPLKKALFVLEKLRLSPLYQWVYETADKDSYVSVTKLTKALKWHPKYSNAQALIKSYRWYQDNYDEIKARTPGITHTVGWDQGILGFFKKFL